MTVRLLKSYGPRPANAVTNSLDASTEAAMIASGQAEADLTGGVKYFVPLPGTVVQPKQIAVGSVSLKMKEQTVVTLPEGSVLRVTGTAGTVVEVTRVNGDKWAIGSDAAAPIGLFSGSYKLTITCTSGSIDG